MAKIRISDSGVRGKKEVASSSKGSAGVPPAVFCILQDTSPGRAMRPRSADSSLQGLKRAVCPRSLEDTGGPPVPLFWRNISPQ